MEKIKNNLSSVVCLALGVWNLIMFAFNYMAMSYMGVTIGTLNGYDIMQLSGGSDTIGSLMVIFHILAFVAGIIMLVWGAMGLVAACAKNFPEKLGKVFGKKACDIVLAVFALLTILAFVFLVVFISKNNFKLRAGGIIAVILVIAAMIVAKLMGKKAK